MARRSRPTSGHALVEMAFLAPWIFLLFLGIVNTGFYYYAAISTANAARVAATVTSSASGSLDDSAGACAAALEEMRPLPNIKSLGATATCAAGCGPTCTLGPMKVTATRIDKTAAPDAALPGAADATQVSVEYKSVQMFPFPGFTGQLTIKRTVQMRRRY